MSKVWSWIKKHWKWIVFPVGILGAVLGWYLWWRSRPGDDVDSGTPDDAADKAVDDVIAAGEERDKALEDLEKEHSDKLAAMTDEQKKEFEKVKEKPIEEVASWIDNL